MMKKSNIIALIIFTISFVGMIVFFVMDNKEEASDTSSIIQQEESVLKEGTAMPSFQLETISGEKISSDVFKSKPIFLMEWASWCPDCHEQMPIIKELYEKYSDKVEFILVDLTDGRDSRDKVEKYMADNNYTMNYYYDFELSVKKSFNIKSIPTMYLIDNKATISKVFDKVSTREELEEVIKNIIN